MEKLNELLKRFEQFEKNVLATLKKHGEDNARQDVELEHLRGKKIGKKKGFKLFKKK